MFTRLFRQSAGAWNVLRYQPVPPGKKPSPGPLGLSLSGLLSMLQSWGRSTTRQETSENAAASAPLGSPRKNFHPASAANSCRAGFALAALTETGRKHAIIAARRMLVLNRIFLRASFRCCLCGCSFFADAGGLGFQGHVVPGGLCESFRGTGGQWGYRTPAPLCFRARRAGAEPRRLRSSLHAS